MLKWLKLSHHSNSGSLQPHEHTSYLPLAILLAVVGFAMGTLSVTAQSPPPQSESVGLTGTVPGPPPKTPATIKSPGSGQHFTTSPITISGTCPKDTLVEIFKNDIFSGSTVCTKNGTFSLQVDLLIGLNTIVARVFDSLNQEGPVSNSVIVYYDVLPSQGAPLTSPNFGGAQMLLNTDAVFRGVFPEKVLSMPLDIIGGTAPYAVNIQWDDSTNKVIPRNDNLGFTVDHTYKKPGTYQVSIQATDTGGRVAFLTVAAIVNGQPAPAAATAGIKNATNTLLLLWPLYVSLLAVVVSFWLGERREKRIFAKHGLTMSAQG